MGRNHGSPHRLLVLPPTVLRWEDMFPESARGDAHHGPEEAHAVQLDHRFVPHVLLLPLPSGHSEGARYLQLQPVQPQGWIPVRLLRLLVLNG